MTQAPAHGPRSSRSPRGPALRPIRRGMWRRQWPLGVVLAGLISSLVVVVVEDYLTGMLMFAGFVLLGAGFRLLLPTRRAGLLVVRNRPLDVATMTMLGVAIAVLAIWVPRIR